MRFFGNKSSGKSDSDEDEEIGIEPPSHGHNQHSSFNLEALLTSDTIPLGSSNAASRNDRSNSLYKGAHRRRPHSIRQSEGSSPPPSPHAPPRSPPSPIQSLWHDSPAPLMKSTVRRRGSQNQSPPMGEFSESLIRTLRIPFFVMVGLVFWGPLILQSSKQAKEGDEGQPQIFQQIFSHPLKSPMVGEEGRFEGIAAKKGTQKDRDEGAAAELSNPVLQALRAVQNLNYELPGRDKIEEMGEEEPLPQDNDKDIDIEDVALNQLSEDEKEELKVGGMKRQLPQAWLAEQQLLKKQQQQQNQLQLQQQKLAEQQRLIEEQLLHEAQAIAAQKKELGSQNQVVARENQYVDQRPIIQNFGHTDFVSDKQQPKVPPRPFELPMQERQQAHANPVQQQPGSGSNYFHGSSPDLVPELLQQTFADIWSPRAPQEVPFFWHIPKCGGTTVADILTHCLDLVSASNIGATEGHGNEPTLKVLTYADKGRYVNVNAATPDGIERAKELGLVQSGLADVIVAHRLHLGATMFDANHQARVFAMFRHPVQRATSMFYYLQRAKWEPTYDHSLADLTLEQYAESGKAEENWITRFLIHEYTGHLTEEHVTMAKEVMRRKLLIGLIDRFGDSLKRFELYFDWWEKKIKPDPEDKMKCQQARALAAQNHQHHPNALESSAGYEKLAKLNWADLQLYHYAVELFDEQQALVAGKDASLTSDYHRGQEPRISSMF